MFTGASESFLHENAHLIPKGGAVLCLVDKKENAAFLAGLGFRVTTLELSDRLAFHDFGTDQWDGIVSIRAALPRKVRFPVHRACVESLKVGGVMLVEDFPNQVSKGDLLEELSGLHVTHALQDSTTVQLIARRPA
jgi:hypothetical protein